MALKKATRKIVLKTANRRGTVSRSSIRKAIQTVFGTAKTTSTARTGWSSPKPKAGKTVKSRSTVSLSK